MPAVDVLVGDTGETTDDGSASPILRMRGGPTGGRRGLADTAGGTDAHADNVTAIASVVNCADDDTNAAIANSAASANANANATADADAAKAIALAHDVFDSPGRRFNRPALEGTNILSLVDRRRAGAPSSKREA